MPDLRPAAALILALALPAGAEGIDAEKRISWNIWCCRIADLATA
ncbi:MAG: hypothetical protein R3D78_05270 [Paracoccaceae bacterium]